MTEVRDIKPMPLEKILELKAQIEKRWDEKPWYEGGSGFNPLGSPGCMMRAEEVLSLVNAATVSTSAGPMLWKDIWQGEVDTIEHLRRIIVKDLKSALYKIIDRSENGELGTSKVADMRNIAKAALEKGEGE